MSPSSSQLGRGTTVRLFLPRLRQDAALSAAPAPNHDDQRSRSGETILIVEDEAGVRRFTGDALRELGYAVLEAEGGEQALALLEDHPQTALLMTDVVMAGMGGHELAERVQQKRPELPVLLTSGYSGTPGSPDLWRPLGASRQAVHRVRLGQESRNHPTVER